MSVWSALGAGAQAAGTVAQTALGALNYKNQKKAYEWQKKAQKKTWRREDKSVQRRAKDLEKAGMSKTLAAGSGAQASGPIKPDPPQTGEMAAQAANVGDALRGVIDIAKTQADKERTEAQTEATKGQESRAQELHVPKLSQEETRSTLFKQDRLIKQDKALEGHRKQVEWEMKRAWQAGRDSFTFPVRRTTDATGEERRDRQELTIDLGSIKNESQLRMLANQIALEQNRANADISMKNRDWYEVRTISNMLFGAARSGSGYMPYAFPKR